MRLRGRRAQPDRSAARPPVRLTHVVPAGRRRLRAAEARDARCPVAAGSRRPPTCATPTPTRCARPGTTARPPTGCARCAAASPLVELGYTFGDELGPYSGRIKSTAEQAVMAREHGEFRVYVLEICLSCGWNHLHRSYVLGDGVPRTPPPAPPGRGVVAAAARRSRRRSHRDGAGAPSGPETLEHRENRLPPCGAHGPAPLLAVLAAVARPRRRSASGWPSPRSPSPTRRSTCPNPNEQATAQATKIYWSDGKTLMASIGEANRTSVVARRRPRPRAEGRPRRRGPRVLRARRAVPPRHHPRDRQQPAPVVTSRAARRSPSSW